MNIKEELRINGYQPSYACEGGEIEKFLQVLIDKNKKTGSLAEYNVMFLMSQAFSYGVINGKREERARRKRIT